MSQPRPPGFVLPFLVTLILSAKVNAALYAAWMILTTVLLIPASPTTTLFTIGAAEPATVANRLRFSLRFCLIFSLLVGVGLYFSSGLLLGVFGPSYALLGGPTLQILSLVVFAVMLKYHYILVKRLDNGMASASILIGTGGVIELTCAYFGGRQGASSASHAVG
jgi:hypothetical protein